MDIRIYGISEDSPDDEAELLFNGLLLTQKRKVLIYKFRHMTQEDYLQRSFSYAILATPNNALNSLWIVFPDACGLDSGGAHNSYELFEKLIEKLRKKIGVDLKRYDINYREFELFLSKKAISFDSATREYILKPYKFSMCCPRILSDSEQDFNKVIEKFEQENYSEALRDLRAIVQQAQMNVIEKLGLKDKKPKKANVNSLAELLKNEGQIDERIVPMFLAFSSITNVASHTTDFPSIEDMKDSIFKKRIILTIYLGLQLIEELNKIIYPKIRLDFTEPSPEEESY